MKAGSAPGPDDLPIHLPWENCFRWSYSARRHQCTYRSRRASIVLVTVLLLPMYVFDDALVHPVSAYEEIQEIIRDSFQDYPAVEMATCHLKMTMAEGNPLSIFLRVAGHGVTIDYCGVRRIWRRCRPEDHLKAQFDAVLCTMFCFRP